MCATAALNRAHLEHRLSVVASSAEDLVDGLDAFLAGDARVVPPGDPAEENVRDDIATQVESAWSAGNVVGDDNRAEYSRKMQHGAAFCRRELGVAHRCVRRAEINRPLGELADSAAGAD